MSDRTAKTDSNGVLAQFIAQPTSQTYQNNGDFFQEKWKGPYSECLNVKNGYIVAGVTFSVNSPRPTLNNKFSSQFDPPQLPTGYTWLINKIQAEQSSAGDHVTLTIDYEPVKYSSEIRNPKSTSQTWSINWQSTSMNVLAYCADNAALSGTAQSQNIVDCARYNRPNKDEIGEDEYYYSWVDPVTGETKTLTKIERAIFRKYKNDQNPIFHYPVITHTQTVHCEKGSSFYPKIAMDLDTVTKDLDRNSGDECPYDTSGYEWLHTGSTMNCQFNSDGTKDYTVQDTWWGAEIETNNKYKGWDGNFYSGGTVKDRDSDKNWKIGEM